MTQILTIAIHIDCHRLGQTSRPPHEINNGCCSPVMFHLRDSLEGFKRAKQNPGADSWLLAGNVQQIGHSLVEVDICVAMPQNERAVACSRPSIGMTAGIAWRISLRFNNPSAQTDMPKIADKRFSDQKSREFDGPGRQLCPDQSEGRCAFNAMIMEASVLSHVASSIVFNLWLEECVPVLPQLSGPHTFRCLPCMFLALTPSCIGQVIGTCSLMRAPVSRCLNKDPCRSVEGA